ncbi:hypothetical protein NP493_6978g00000 [Ridgeia piscesae]|uniref:Chitin-binding type-2 domain-containing protein n=1 Tax=Ridgeia piscesae TaxID=27915 RepID=A0AAD9IQ08_RIDPI|nr:hypothetical protein NP493_6978g00000 [Ridgeia piscesae]
MYVSCIEGEKMARIPCPDDMVWDDKLKKCATSSTTCKDLDVTKKDKSAKSRHRVRRSRHWRAAQPLDGRSDTDRVDDETDETEATQAEEEDDVNEDDDDQENIDDVGDEEVTDAVQQVPDEVDGDEKVGENRGGRG